MRTERGLWVLFASQVLMVAGLSVAFPFFSLYLNRSRGLGMGMVGVCISVALALVALSQGLGGELSDSWGRRRVMVGALWARVVTVGLLGEAVRSSWPLPAVIAIHWLAAFLGNFFNPAAQAWIADSYGVRQRLKAYGLLRVATNLGWAVGPALGGLVAERSYPLLFFASSAACAACALILSLWLKDAARAPRQEPFAFSGLWHAARDGRFLEFCLWTFLIALVMAQMISPLSVHAALFAGLSDARVGALFSVNGSMVVALQMPLTRWLEKRRTSASLAAASLCYAAGYGLVGLASGFLALAGCMVIVSLGEMALTPSLQALAANMAPERYRGRYAGFHLLMQHAGFALGPLAGGLGLQYLSPSHPALPWTFVAVVGVLAAWGFARLGRQLSEAEQGAAAGLELAADAPGLVAPSALPPGGTTVRR